MKKFLYIIVATLLLSCNGKNVPDCFQNAGAIVQKEFTVAAFSEIIVFERVQLILKDAPEQRIMVETGEYLMDEIVVEVENGILLLKDENGCNLTRDYGLTKVYVSAPNINSIRSSTGLPILSDGVLNYPNLSLISENFDAEGLFHTVGDFRLEVNCMNLNVTTNNLSHMFLSGAVENLTVGFYSGNSRFEGRHLIAQNILIFQRSSNDMILNPQLSLVGEIRSTGHVILVNQPPVVDVQAYYTGRLIVE
ncbi:MAG: head GIN domain-containing protein [Gelidibacter sp.]